MSLVDFIQLSLYSFLFIFKFNYKPSTKKDNPTDRGVIKRVKPHFSAF